MFPSGKFPSDRYAVCVSSYIQYKQACRYSILIKCHFCNFTFGLPCLGCPGVSPCSLPSARPCCSLLPLTCSTHWLGFMERHNTSVFLVLIFILIWSHSAENRLSVRWRPYSEDVSSTKMSAKSKRFILQLSKAKPSSTRMCLSKSSRLWRAAVTLRAGLKGRGDQGQFSLAGPHDVFHDVIRCIIYVFADSQRSRLLFPVVDYVPGVLTRLLAAFDCKPHEMVLKINVSCPWL